MDRGAWRAIVHRVAKSWTRVSNRKTTILCCAYLFTFNGKCLSQRPNIWKYIPGFIFSPLLK